VAYLKTLFRNRRRVTSVSVMNRLRLGSRGKEFQFWVQTFLFFDCTHAGCGVHSISYSLSSWGILPGGGKLSGCEANHSLNYFPRLRKSGPIPPLPHIPSLHAQRRFHLYVSWQLTCQSGHAQSKCLYPYCYTNLLQICWGIKCDREHVLWRIYKNRHCPVLGN